MKDILQDTKFERIVSHRNCGDGTASAMFLMNLFPEATIEFVTYGPDREALAPSPNTLFWDMTPPSGTARAFIDSGGACMDHHKTQRDIVEAFGDRGWYENTEEDDGALCGAEAAYDSYASRMGADERAREFARLCGVYDLWRKKDRCWDRAENIRYALLQFPFSYWLTRALDEVFMPNDEDTRVGRIARNKDRREAQEVIGENRYSVGVTSNGIRVAYAPLGAVNAVADELLDADLADVVYLPRLHHGATINNFRSRGRVDVGGLCREVAETFGTGTNGGGHRDAGGYTIQTRWGLDGETAALVDQFAVKGDAEK